MRKYNRFLTFCLFTIFAIAACSPEDKPDADRTVIDMGGETPTQFDKYLTNKYVEPYNIEFLYRWKDVESSLNYTLVPADYTNSVRMANLVKYLCLDAYEAVAPDDFLKKYFPKMIMLVGSFAYQNNGTFILGTAEGGLKITLYGINTLDPTNINQLYEYYFRTIFHEFSHILHQTTDYSNDFRMLTPSEYVGDSWSAAENTELIALEKGFISRYSRKEANEDFVELISYYITYTDVEWEAALTDAGTDGAAIINQKITIVKNYMKNVWDIDLDALKNEVQTRAANIQNIDLDNINF